MTQHSRNAAVRNMALTDGDEETKQFVREHYGIPNTITDWPTIDDMAEAAQREQNKAYQK